MKSKGKDKRLEKRTCEYFSECIRLAGKTLDELDKRNQCYSGGNGCYLKAVYSFKETEDIGIGGIKGW